MKKIISLICLLSITSIMFSCSCVNGIMPYEGTAEAVKHTVIVPEDDDPLSLVDIPPISKEQIATDDPDVLKYMDDSTIWLADFDGVFYGIQHTDLFIVTISDFYGYRFRTGGSHVFYRLDTKTNELTSLTGGCGKYDDFITESEAAEMFDACVKAGYQIID